MEWIGRCVQGGQHVGVEAMGESLEGFGVADDRAAGVWMLVGGGGCGSRRRDDDAKHGQQMDQSPFQEDVEFEEIYLEHRLGFGGVWAEWDFFCRLTRVVYHHLPLRHQEVLTLPVQSSQEFGEAVEFFASAGGRAFFGRGVGVLLALAASRRGRRPA